MDIGMSTKKLPWVYQRCEVVKVRDGDTFDVRMDIGFGLSMEVAVRLKGINCEEMKGSKADLAERARKFTEDVLTNSKQCTVLSYGWDKYGGRIDAEVMLSDGRSLNNLLVESGLARVVK